MSLHFESYIELATGLVIQVCKITENNQYWLAGTYSPVDMKPGQVLLIYPKGKWVTADPDEFELDFILKSKLDFKSAANARGYAQELSYLIGHPDESGLNRDQLIRAELEFRLVKKFLAECDEPY